MLGEDIPGWGKRFFDLAKALTETITTHQQFVRLLNDLLAPLDCPIKRLCITCSHQERVILRLEAGLPASELRESKCWEQSIGPDSISVSLCVTYWLAEGGTMRLEHFRPVVALLESFLSIQNRRIGLMILDSKNRPEIVARLSKTIDTCSSHPACARQAIVWMDLDNFGKVNKVVGQATGDLALRDLESDILDISQETDVVGFSDGGDEYILYFPNCDDFLVLSTLNELRKRVAARAYGPAKDQRVGMTAGAARPTPVSASFNDILERAEHAAHKKGKEAGTKGDKKRGTVSFDREDTNVPAIVSPELFAKLGIAILRSGCINPKPFANQALNFISQQVCGVLARSKVDAKEQKGTISEVVAEIEVWLGLETVSTVDERHLVGNPHFSPAVPSIALGLAISHGILRAAATERSIVPEGGLNLEMQLCEGLDRCCVRERASQTILWGETRDDGQWLSIGQQVEVETVAEEGFLPLCLVLAVGLTHRLATPSDNALARGMFAGMVVVDDRPYLGGGLPDFWQAALANLVALRHASADTVRRIIILGDRTSAPQTSRLLSGGDADIIKNIAEEIAPLAGCSTREVEAFLQWAATSVTDARDFSDTVSALYESALALELAPKSTGSGRRPPSATLPRAVLQDGLELPPAEGLLCKTPSQAYPAVLDRLRHSGDSVLTRDDAHQDMYELLGFKLLIENPAGEAIPDYWQSQHKSMDAYAHSVLIDENSKIGREFHGDGQFERFISHLIGYFDKGAGNASTRRAILVVPNAREDNDPDTPKPLGLVSIWATPRHSAGQDQLSFCFVWRTVEALVGFPYSLYGSIKFANFVVDSINSRLRRQVSRISLGPLRYLALSLHMRTDEYHRRFAKRIVDAASD